MPSDVPTDVPNPQDYGSITQLRELLGLVPPHTSENAHPTAALPEDALIVSIDTEWERQGPEECVVEIGFTVLDTRDIINITPGPYDDGWFSKTKTYHYVACITQRRSERMRACYFSKDLFMEYSTMKRHIAKTLRRATYAAPDDRPIGRGPRKVVLVGHSVVMDLQSLYQAPSLELDFLSTGVFRMKPTTVFDTFMLTVAAKQQGAKIRSRALGWLVNWLGVHRRYRCFGSVKGCDNAGNDAAYTMMALLKFALRWDRIVSRRKVPLHREKDERQEKLPSKPHDSTFEGLRSRLEDTKLEESTPVVSEEQVELITSSLSTPGTSAEAEQEHVKLKPLLLPSPSVSAEAEEEHVEPKPFSLPASSESAKAAPSSQPVSTGNSFWGLSLQKLTGWWQRSWNIGRSFACSIETHPSRTDLRP